MTKVFNKLTETFFQHDSPEFSIMILGTHSCFKVTYWHDTLGREASGYITGESCVFDVLTGTEHTDGVVKMVKRLCDKYPEEKRKVIKKTL